MGCSKLTYGTGREGALKKPPLKILGALEKKNDSPNFCIDYYPFGLTFNSYQRPGETEQKYLYNGKELQTDLDLGWYDYGARMYMPDIGRFFSVDPKVNTFTSLSPYVYAANNPILFIDKNGEGPIDPRTGDRKSVNFTNIERFHIFRIYAAPDAPDATGDAYDGSLVSSARWERMREIGLEMSGKGWDGSGVGDGRQRYKLSSPYFDFQGGDETDNLESAQFISNAWAKELAGRSGNYLYLEENGDDAFTVGTVINGEINMLQEFIKGEDGTFSLSTTTTFEKKTSDTYQKKGLFGKVKTYQDVTTTSVIKNEKTGDITRVEHKTYRQRVNVKDE